MAKLKAFVLSIGFASVTALVVFCAVGLALLGLHIKLSLGETASVLLALIASLCFSIPAVGHVLVRRPKLTSGVLWITSLIVGLFTTWLVFFLQQVIVSFVSPLAHVSYGEEPLKWSLILLPLTFVFSRALLSGYLSLLDRFGLLDAF